MLLAVHEENGPAPCLLRFDLAAQKFDPDFKLDLNELAEGRATGSLVVTPGGQALIHVLDEESAEPLIPTPINNPRVLSSADLWHTAKLSLGDEPSIEILDIPLTSASVLPFVLDDDLRVTTTFGEVKHLYEITDDGTLPTERANGEVPGTVFSVVQLR